MQKILFLILAYSSLHASNNIHYAFMLGALIILIITMVYTIKTIHTNKKGKIKPYKKENFDYSGNQEVIIKTRNFDIRDNLLYFFKTLNYDAAKNDNTILSQISLEAEDPNGDIKECYEFSGDPELLISTINIIIQLFNKKLNQSTFMIKLLMFAISSLEASFNFTLQVYALDKDKAKDILNTLNTTNTRQSNELQSIIKALAYIKGSELKIDLEELTVSFHFMLPKSIAKDKPIIKNKKLPSKEQISVYIAHNDTLIVNTIIDSLQKEKLANPFIVSLEKFIDFSHNAVSSKNLISVFFVATDFLKFIENTHKNTLFNMQKEKHMKIFAIAKNYNDIDYIKHHFDFVEILMLPYTNEYFEIVINKILNKY